jgi:23S rRNA (adenine1618-N6)-methyltransferase
VHPRNRFRSGYDFPALIGASDTLGGFVRTTPAGRASIDFSDPDAVASLNQALLLHEYDVRWSLPIGALCPPIPGRADYIHHLADVLAGTTGAPPRGASTRIIDIGSGANCVYPIIGAREYGWSFVATEIDQTSLRWARQVVRINRSISKRIEHRLQPNPLACFEGVTRPGERFDASMCNPPFHASATDAADGNARKRRNLKLGDAAALNFGGRPGELWCAGGEVGFIERMIVESAARPRLCRWFTTLVSKSEHLPRLRRSLRAAAPTAIEVIGMTQGQKTSRILAWSFV